MQAFASGSPWSSRTARLFDSLSVRENVAFPLRERGGLDEEQIQQIVDRLIRMVGAEDVAEALPASLSTGAGVPLPWRVRWQHSRKWCFTTSRPPWLTPSSPADWAPDSAAQTATGLYQHRGYTRYALCGTLADTVLFLHQGRAAFFGPLSAFMVSPDPNIQQFLTLDTYAIPTV